MWKRNKAQETKVKVNENTNFIKINEAPFYLAEETNSDNKRTYKIIIDGKVACPEVYEDKNKAIDRILKLDTTLIGALAETINKLMKEK